MLTGCSGTRSQYCQKEKQTNKLRGSGPGSAPPESTLTFVLLFVAIELPRRESEVTEAGVVGGRHPAVPPALCGDSTGQEAGQAQDWAGAGLGRPAKLRPQVAPACHLHPETPPGSTLWPAPRGARTRPRVRREPKPWGRASLLPVPLRQWSPQRACLETTSPVTPRDYDIGHCGIASRAVHAGSIPNYKSCDASRL